MYTHIYRSYKITNQAPRLTESVLIQNNSGLDDAASWMTGHSRSSRQIWNLVLVVLDHLRWASIWQGFLAHHSQAWENGSASKMWMPNSYLRAPNVWNRYDPRLLDWWNVLHHSCDFFFNMSVGIHASQIPFRSQDMYPGECDGIQDSGGEGSTVHLQEHAWVTLPNLGCRVYWFWSVMISIGLSMLRYRMVYVTMNPSLFWIILNTQRM